MREGGEKFREEDRGSKGRRRGEGRGCREGRGT